MVAGIPEVDLGPDVVCGSLTVPENRSSPTGRTITLTVATLKAQSPDPDRAPMVYLNGGPGSSILPLGERLRGMGINRDRDVILVSQRGTLHADPQLTCPEIDDVTAASVGLSILAPETARLGVDAVQACRDRLAANGTDLAAFNTIENAADFADLRTAMGIDSWHVYGVSYGTDLALQLIRNHPEGIRSVILDSVVPPQKNLLTNMWGNVAGGLGALFDACEAQPRCVAAYPDLRNEFTVTVDRLAENPLLVDVPASPDLPAQRVVLDGYKLANVAVLASMDASRFAGLPQMIHQTAGGDGSALAETVATGVPTPDLMGHGLRLGVLCREFAPFTTVEDIVAAGRQALPGFPAGVLALQPQFGRVIDDCAVWDVGSADPAVSLPVHSDLPVLVLAGTFDAITQASSADVVAQTLPNSTVVRFPAIGHDVYEQSECGRKVTADFLVDPSSVDLGCVAAMPMPDFIS
jgi:pimeloyl-ACP methyl ester carboxylesterase